MKLNLSEIKNSSAWEKIGVKLPSFDIEAVGRNTDERVQWLHFGAGNIFRGFIARINQEILNCDAGDTGIIAADSFDSDIIDKIYTPYDNLTMLMRLRADGGIDKEVIAGVARAYKANMQNEDYIHIISAFENPSLQMVSMTVTEKGYNLKTTDGAYLGIVMADIENGPENAVHIMSICTSLLLRRFNKGGYPIAMCSMDNCSHNGARLREAILDIAKKWVEKGYATPEFLNYLTDENRVGFPWSMIDKITPRPAKSVEEELCRLGIEGMTPIVTDKNTFIAPFVNAEIPEYLVIEDRFPNGRPNLEKGGVYVTDRETVNMTETMKVTTCLNPLHTALAVYGCVLGYNRIYEEMRDAELIKLVETIGYNEGMPVVVDPKIISPKSFIDEVVNDRLKNPFIPDEPQRIATDTSQKVGIRFGETIKAYIADENLEVTDLTAIPLAIAGWFRYLLAVDDEGNPFELSPDPLKEELTEKLATIKLGGGYNGELKPLLSNEKIFGTDLVACGLSDKIETMFTELIADKGAVRATLVKYLKG